MPCRTDTKKVGNLKNKFEGKLRGLMRRKLDAGLKQSFQRISDAYSNTAPVKGISIWEQIIADSVNDAIRYNDPSLLQEMITEIDNLVKDGKSRIETLITEREKKIKEDAEIMAADTSRLSLIQQKIKQELVRILDGTEEGDKDVIAVLAKEAGVDVRSDNFTDPKEMARKIYGILQRKDNPPFSNAIIKRVQKWMGSAANWGYRDLDGMLDKVSRRGNNSLSESSNLVSMIDIRLREANEVKYQTIEAQQNLLGALIEKVYGLPVKDFTGNKSAIDQNNYYTQLIREQALRVEGDISEIGTGIFDEAGNEIVVNKGELIQLYMDSLNENVVESMNNAGLSEEKLLELVTTNLTDQDRKFAMAMVHEFYPALYEMENEVHKKVYFTSMPKSELYGGQVSYQGDIEVNHAIGVNGIQNRQSTSVTLNNALERKGTTVKKLNLNRNVFSNAVNRINNSASFIGGAEIYSEVNAAWNSPIVKQTVKKNNAADYHGKINDKIQENFGLKQHTGGKLPKFLNWIKGNFVHAALAAKAKLMLTQITSAALWFDTDTAWKGLKKSNRHPDLNGMNISELLYNNSATLRNRYKGQNLIALDAQLDAAADQAHILLKDRNKTWEAYKDFNMAFTKWGDNIGIMGGGKAYFSQAYKEARDAGKSHEEAIKEGVARFNKKWQKAQQSYEAIDRADAQKGWASLFTMFLTSPFQLGRHTFSSLKELGRAAVGSEYKGTVGQNLAKFGLYHFYSGASFAFITQTLPALLLGKGDEEDEWLKLLYAGMKGPWINSVFLLGDIYAAVENKILGHKFESSIGQTSAFTSLTKGWRYTDKIWTLMAKPSLTYKERQQLDSSIWNATMELVQVTGIATKSYGFFKDKEGVTEVQKIVDNMINGKFGKEDALRLAGYSAWTIDQAKGPEPKKSDGFKKKKSSFDKKKGFNKSKGFSKKGFTK